MRGLAPAGGAPEELERRTCEGARRADFSEGLQKVRDEWPIIARHESVCFNPRSAGHILNDMCVQLCMEGPQLQWHGMVHYIVTPTSMHTSSDVGHVVAHVVEVRGLRANRSVAEYSQVIAACTCLHAESNLLQLAHERCELPIIAQVFDELHNLSHRAGVSLSSSTPTFDHT